MAKRRYFLLELTISNEIDVSMVHTIDGEEEITEIEILCDLLDGKLDYIFLRVSEPLKMDLKLSKIYCANDVYKNGKQFFLFISGYKNRNKNNSVTLFFLYRSIFPFFKI